MLTRIGIPLFVLMAMFMLIGPPHASAGVRVGVYLGAPAYRNPVYPRAYSYAPPPDAYYSAPGYGYADSYNSYPAPVYGYRNDSWRRHENHERMERREHEYREHEGRGREGYGRGWR
jgi:hypothetical protein